jgi:hypothetical protein
MSSANLSGILSTARSLSSADVARLRDEWRKAYSGPKNSMQYKVLAPGEKFDLADLIGDCQERLKPHPRITYRPAPPSQALYLLGTILAVGGMVAGLLLAIAWINPWRA